MLLTQIVPPRRVTSLSHNQLIGKESLCWMTTYSTAGTPTALVGVVRLQDTAAISGPNIRPRMRMGSQP